MTAYLGVEEERLLGCTDILFRKCEVLPTEVSGPHKMLAMATCGEKKNATRQKGKLIDN